MSAFLDIESPELERAWTALADRGEDIDARHQGEAWQYVGSSQDSGAWQHCFRHRSHPRGGERIYLTVPASAAWAVAQEARL